MHVMCNCSILAYQWSWFNRHDLEDLANWTCVKIIAQRVKCVKLMYVRCYW